MTTRRLVLEQLEAYLNHELSLAKLVHWAEKTLIEPNIAEDEDVDLLMDILTYLGAADTKGFPLTWEVLSDFL
ncbi:MAG: hypothetical protein H7175_11880, partial [Burkholderiales bacterium]|nr:hypothetical protein [Anaerolineae bacterium]